MKTPFDFKKQTIEAYVLPQAERLTIIYRKRDILIRASEKLT